MPMTQQDLLNLILNGPGAAQPPATGLPPFAQPTTAAGPSYASGLAEPTPAGAVQDERQRLLQQLGAAPQLPVPDAPKPWQSVLGGLADALGNYASARYGAPPPQQSYLNSLDHLRRRREAIMARNSEATTEAQQRAAKIRLDELDKQEYRKWVEENQQKRDFADAEKEWWKGNVAFFAGQNKAKSDRYNEAWQSARDAGVDLSKLDPKRRQDPDYLDSLTSQEIAKRNQEKSKKESDQMTAAQEQAAIRALADDFYRSNTRPTKKMVTKTDPYGGTSTQETTVDEPGITYAEAMQMARDEFYGTHTKVATKKPDAAPNKITLESVRDKIGGR